MKIFKIILFGILLLFITGFSVLATINLPKLDIISGYSAKMMNSSVFVAQRAPEYTDSTDVNMDLVRLADDRVDYENASTEADVYGLKKRTAIYREGLGSVLINDDYDPDIPYLQPKRSVASDTISFPYGNGKPQDTIFSHIDYKELDKVVESAFDSISKTRSVLVLYKNHIIAEKYAEGFNENSLLLGWSMTKSILSTLYGILQYEGKLNIHDVTGLKEWQEDERKEITYNHLLHMSSGLEWEEDYSKISDATKMLFLEADMSHSQLIKPLVAEPESVFNYSSGTTNLLSGILKREFKDQQSYLDFPYTHLLDKISMNSALIEADLESNYVGSSYGWANTRDWAKFGLLYLHKGNWNGDQIFDHYWAEYVSTPAKASKGRYGAQFWLNAEGYMPDVPRDVYYADGFQGQRVFIIPSHDMVVVRMGLDHIDFNSFLKGIIDAVE